jgi:hypothetical protein
MFTNAVLALVNDAYDGSAVEVAVIVASSLVNALSISAVLDDEPATPIIAVGGRTVTTTVFVSDETPVIVKVAFAFVVGDVVESAFLIVMPFITICNLVPDAICDVLAVSATATLNTGVNVTVVPDNATLNDDIGLSAAGVADITVATQFVDVRETGSTIPAVVSSAATHDNETVPLGDGIIAAVVKLNVKLTPVKSVGALDGGLRRIELLLTGFIVSPSIY